MTTESPFGLSAAGATSFHRKKKWSWSFALFCRWSNLSLSLFPSPSWPTARMENALERRARIKEASSSSSCAFERTGYERDRGADGLDWVSLSFSPYILTPTFSLSIPILLLLLLLFPLASKAVDLLLLSLSPSLPPLKSPFVGTSGFIVFSTKRLQTSLFPLLLLPHQVFFSEATCINFQLQERR